jgi:hypothetical protein
MLTPIQYLWLPLQAGVKLEQSFRSFGEDLKFVPMGASHDIEYLCDVVWGYLTVEKIAHAVHKHAARLLPAQGEFEHTRLQREFKTVPVVFLSHGLQAMGEAFSVTELAAGADL